MEKDLELRVSELEKMLFLSKNVLSFAPGHIKIALPFGFVAG